MKPRLRLVDLSKKDNFFEVKISQAISLKKSNMKQSLITDHFEKSLCLKSIGTISYSEYKRIEMQNYLRTIISDTFARIFWTLNDDLPGPLN